MNINFTVLLLVDPFDACASQLELIFLNSSNCSFHLSHFSLQCCALFCNHRGIMSHSTSLNWNMGTTGCICWALWPLQLLILHCTGPKEKNDQIGSSSPKSSPGRATTLSLLMLGGWKCVPVPVKARGTSTK